MKREHFPQIVLYESYIRNTMKKKHLINLALIFAAGWLITYSPIGLNKGPHAFDDGSFFDHHLKKHTQEENNILIDVNDFNEFIKEGEWANEFTESFDLDSTGDGKKEKVFTSISWQDDNCVISSSITDGKKTIWNDQYTITAELAQHFYPNVDPKNIKQLQYYLGLCQLNFLERFDRTTEALDSKKNLLTSKMMEGPYCDTERIEIESYLNEYGGYFLGTLNLFDDSLYSWNDNKKAFVLIANS